MYIPKNKISTNLYTQGRELVLKSTGRYYKGFYYKTFEGKFFTGKTPNDKPTQELLKVAPADEDESTIFPQTQIALSDEPTPFDTLDSPIYSEETIINYSKLKNTNLNDIPKRFLPTQQYPKPTQEDYDLGTFTRYFCVKVNENQYFELTQQTYNNLDSQSKEWAWELYTPFDFQWTIKGEKSEVEKTNYNVVLLTEKRLKRKGLQLFLKNNYLKFWKS